MEQIVSHTIHECCMIIVQITNATASVILREKTICKQSHKTKKIIAQIYGMDSKDGSSKPEVMSVHQGPTLQACTVQDSPKPQQGKKSFTPLHMVSGVKENPYHPLGLDSYQNKSFKSMEEDPKTPVRRSFSSHLLYQTDYPPPETIQEEDYNYNFSESIYCTLPSRRKNKKIPAKQDATFSMPASPAHSMDHLSWTRRDSSARSFHGSNQDFDMEQYRPFESGHVGRKNPTRPQYRRADLAREDSGINTSQSDLSGDFSQSRFGREMDSVIKNLSQKQERNNSVMSSSLYQHQDPPSQQMYSSLQDPFLSYSDISKAFSSNYKDSDAESIDSRSTLTEGPRYSLCSEPRYSFNSDKKYSHTKDRKLISASHHDISNSYRMNNNPRRNSCNPEKDLSLGSDWRRRKDSLSSGYMTDRRELFEQNYQRDRKCSVAAPPQQYLPDLQLRPLSRQDSTSSELSTSVRRDSSCSLPPSHLFMPTASPAASAMYSSQLSLYMAPSHNRDIHSSHYTIFAVTFDYN